jgi:hypothetical protein
MGHATKLDELRAKVARIESEPGFDFAASVPSQRPAPAPEPEPLPEELPPQVGQFDDVTDADSTPQPFGAWLLEQGQRKGWIADLAKWAKSDRGFPRNGSVQDVRKRLTAVQAEGDAFEALDDAEMDWASY